MKRSRFAKRVGRHVAWVLGSLLLVGSGPTLEAQQRLPVLGKARAARHQAEKTIPWNELTPEATAKLRRVLQDTTVFRRMPEETIECDPDLFVFLVRHPEVVVNIWQHMGITRCTLKRTKPFEMEASDGAGTKSRVELVYGSRNLHVLYAEGSYSGTLVTKPVNGQCVMILRSRVQPGQPASPAQTRITGTMDVFLKIDHAGAEVVAKALSPVVGRTVDNNFTQTMKFVEQIAKVARVNSDGMQRLALQLDQLDRNVRDRFALLTARIGRNEPAGGAVQSATN